MKLSKDQVKVVREIAEPYLSSENEQASALAGTVFNLCDTIQAIHASIDTLADSFEAQGRIAEAQAVRGLNNE